MKRFQIKRVIALVFACMLCAGNTAFAVNQGDPLDVQVQATPSGSALTGAQSKFTISESSGYAAFGATTTGTDAATSVTVSMVVQRRINGAWTDVPNTFKVATTSTSRIVSIEGSRFLEKGYWYRLQSVHIAFVGNVSYSETIHSQLWWYN